MSILAGIVFGGLAGWAASILMGNNRQQGCLGNIIVGVVGAFIGGLILQFLGQDRTVWAWSWPSFGAAVLGAVLLLAITGPGRRGRR